MKYKKMTALVLAVAMMAGNGMTALAADTDPANGASGTGTLLPHLDKEITAVTLPTESTVATVFNYTVDPEQLIKDSSKLSSGTTVTGNADGVYFSNTGGGYSSSSDAVQFQGKNSVDVDVTVVATVEKTEGSNNITLVADEDALNAATTPALLMNLKVGTDTKAITSDGATAKAKIEGVPNNFAVDVADGKYTYAIKADATDSSWKSTTVQLVGKTNKVNVPTGDDAITAPKITLTWTIAKHEEYTDTTAHGNWSGSELWIAKDANTGFSTTGLIVEVSDGGTTYKTLASDKYTISDTGWVSTTWANMVEGIGSEPTGNIFLRITDGTTRYIFENK